MKALLVASSLAVVLGCHGVTEPISSGTTFVLESVNGAGLPAASGSSPTATTLIADTLIFQVNDNRTSGKFQDRQTRLSGTYTPQTLYWASYDWKDGALSILWSSCPVGAFCISNTATPATGHFGPGTLIITYGTSGLYSRTYRRVS